MVWERMTPSDDLDKEFSMMRLTLKLEVAALVAVLRGREKLPPLHPSDKGFVECT